MGYEYGIGIWSGEPLKATDGAMAEEKADGRLTSIVVSLYLLRGRLGNTLHVALLCLTCAEFLSSNADQRQWR